MRPFVSYLAGSAALLVLGGCALLRSPDDPARAGQTVTLVNSLTWTNPLSGKRDGQRTAWPLAPSAPPTEHFPLAQLRQCDAAGACSWGVLKAERSIGAVRYQPDGVAIDLELVVDVARSQQAARTELNAAMAIPGDVPALSAKRTVKRTLVLGYGKVERIELDFGVAFDLCVARLDAARRNVDQCAIPFI